jgi:methyl-accepting chemotaxis protein
LCGCQNRLNCGAIVEKLSNSQALDCTIFDLDGDVFVRLHTSLKNDSGDSAEGTLLDRQSAPYQALIGGRCHVGQVSLFGKDVDACYSPLLNSTGEVTGAIFVCLDEGVDVNLIRKMTD